MNPPSRMLCNAEERARALPQESVPRCHTHTRAASTSCRALSRPPKNSAPCVSTVQPAPGCPPPPAEPQPRDEGPVAAKAGGFIETGSVCRRNSSTHRNMEQGALRTHRRLYPLLRKVANLSPSKIQMNYKAPVHLAHLRHISTPASPNGPRPGSLMP